MQAKSSVPVFWVCTRCSLEGRGLRGRMASETCPRCENPGAGMVLVRASAEEASAKPESVVWLPREGKA